MRTALAIPLTLAVALSSAGCGGPILFAELEEKSVCKTVRDVPFDPTTPGVPLEKSFPFPLGDYLPLFQTADADVTIQLVDLTFNAGTGIIDFNIVDEATISVLPPDGSTELPVVPAAYAKDINSLPGTKLVIGAQGAIDLSPYMDATSTLNLQTVMTGTLPDNVWTADVRGCIYMKARINYGTSYGL